MLNGNVPSWWRMLARVEVEEWRMGPSGGPLPPPDKELASLTEQEGRRGRGLAVGGASGAT